MRRPAAHPRDAMLPAHRVHHFVALPNCSAALLKDKNCEVRDRLHDLSCVAQESHDCQGDEW